MSLKKKYLKTKPICKVRFEIPKSIANNAETINVVGVFNGWDMGAHPMKKQKNGNFVSTIELSVGNEYEFRYLYDHTSWENDHAADKYVPTCFGDCENSVVIV